MLSLIGSAMGRELSTGIDAFLSALRNAGRSTDSVSDDQPPELSLSKKGKNLKNGARLPWLKSAWRLTTDPPGIKSPGLVIHCVHPETNVRRML